MIINIIVTILSILGIYGFYNNNLLLLNIGAISVIIELIIGIITNQSKSNSTSILSAIIGIICTKKIWDGIAIGLCFESVILSILGWIIVITSFMFGNKEKI